MSKPKILVSHNNFPQAILEQLMKVFDVQIIDKPMIKTTKQDLVDNIFGKFALLGSRVPTIDEQVIEAAGPSLKVISTTSMGYEHIDTNALKKRGIILCNTVHATTDRVAELTVGLLIATARNFLDANQQMKLGKFPTSVGMGLTNSVVGIIGCGNIGIAVAKMLRGFKLNELLYTSRKPKPEMECLGGQLVSTDYLVGRSDYIILATVLVPETTYIINKDRLALMKPNAVIINVGRGKLINQDDLVEALQTKRIRGAGLDVMTPEPLPLDHPLMTMDNVVLLPHIAGGNTIEAPMEKSQLAIDNIFAVFNNQPIPCEVKL
ncbi:glyoxylate reductase/hydroxypyruvate reductase-like isoform X1 [Aphis gossypii]|uniref:glyoxylate reductase/hydroxypyruvate reductase-like isoform X1 n=2 Tax=Aphis gossypii TaxID=80765 RepID=UPI0021599470|nr:glyoxylate reductase/hydroxypyruvate reductase-like isoform X1 [Aphis gossypii]XP_050055558.1 glyoxylate reductase/hydroxypyruvate reductase-like isoform X1 [Aphis gossypii]